MSYMMADRASKWLIALDLIIYLGIEGHLSTFTLVLDMFLEVWMGSLCRQAGSVQVKTVVFDYS